MRQIKFRGKTSTLPANDAHEQINGIWFYGYLVGDNKGNFYIKESLKSEGVWIEPATVGQFTGLFDKNGNEIYEDDKLLIKGNATAVVVWRNEGFDILDTCSWTPTNKGDIEGFVYVPTKTMRIIGNIHDNPELLKTE